MEARNFSSVARELSAAFVSATRTNGEHFVKLADNAPGWMETIPRAIHEAVDGKDCRLPCDWVYSIAARAARAAAEYETGDDARDELHGFADSVVDTGDRAAIDWTAHPYNSAIADEAADEYGAPAAERGEGFSAAVLRWARGGQYMAAARVYSCIVDAIEARAAE